MELPPTGGYQRVDVGDVRWRALTPGFINEDDIYFPKATASWGDVHGFALYADDGAMVDCGGNGATHHIGTGVTASFREGLLFVKCDPTRSGEDVQSYG
jgi:hypothetical protein